MPRRPTAPARAPTLAPHTLPPRTRWPLTSVALAVQLALLAGTGTLAAWSTPVAAQTAAGSAATVRQYDIPAGPLNEALMRFSGDAGILLAGASAQAQGRTSPGLRGAYDVTQGLAALLAGTGLQAYRHADGSYGLRPAPGPDGAVSTLSAVTVTANQLGEITEGTGTYAPGTIATATRLVLSPRETPQSISVINREEMNDFNLTSIDKVMERTPGVSIVTYDSERTEYYARGFPIQNFQYDGIPTSRDSAYSAGQTLTDMAIYDRVEVLKGATGLLTGTGDPGATINLVRKKPTRAFQGHASLGAGSWDNYRGEFDVSGPLNASGSVRGRAVAAYQDKHSQLRGYQRSTGVLYGIVEADLTPDTLLTVGADWQKSNPKGSTWGGNLLYDSTGAFNDMPRSFNNGARWSSWEQYANTVFATLEHQFDNDWVAKVQLNHQVNGYDAQLAAAAGGNPNPVTGAGVRLWGPSWYDGKTTSDTADLYASGPVELFGRRHDVVIGGTVSRRKWASDSYTAPAGYNRNVPNYYTWEGNAPYPSEWVHTGRFDTTTNENGVYATTRLNLRDDLKVIAGARVVNYKDADTQKSGMVTPYLGAVYDLLPQVSAYASYTAIYKPQTAQTVEGRTLDPLEGKNYEAGLKGAFLDGRLNASAAYFLLDQDNFAEYTDGVTPSGGQAARAIDGVRTRGYELEVTGALTRAWLLHAGFSHKVSRQQGSKVATLTPENVFTLSTTYALGGALNGLTVGGGARWQDRTWGAVTNLVDPSGPQVDAVAKSYWLFDVMARYRFNANWSATLNVNNVFDKKYYSIFNWYSTYTWGEPRSVFLNVRYDF